MGRRRGFAALNDDPKQQVIELACCGFHADPAAASS